MATRICKTCKVEKDLSCFRARKRNNKVLYEYECKECGKPAQKLRSRKHYDNNTEKIKLRAKAHRIENIEHVRIVKINYYHKNIDAIRKYKKQYARDHAEKIAQKQKLYRLKNREKILARKVIYYSDKKHVRLLNNKWRSTRLKIDINFKLRSIISSRVWDVIKNNKNGSILSYLPYSIQELKNHIENQFESWMTWENWGKYNPNNWDDNDTSTWKWQLDHIIPHSTFKYTSMENEAFKKCWALNNLRPLNAKQNIIDGASKVRHFRKS